MPKIISNQSKSKLNSQSVQSESDTKLYNKLHTAYEDVVIQIRNHSNGQLKNSMLAIRNLNSQVKTALQQVNDPLQVQKITELQDYITWMEDEASASINDAKKAREFINSLENVQMKDSASSNDAIQRDSIEHAEEAKIPATVQQKYEIALNHLNDQHSAAHELIRPAIQSIIDQITTLKTIHKDDNKITEQLVTVAFCTSQLLEKRIELTDYAVVIQSMQRQHHPGLQVLGTLLLGLAVSLTVLACIACPIIGMAGIGAVAAMIGPYIGGAIVGTVAGLYAGGITATLFGKSQPSKLATDMENLASFPIPVPITGR